MSVYADPETAEEVLRGAALTLRRACQSLIECDWVPEQEFSNISLIFKLTECIGAIHGGPSNVIPLDPQVRRGAVLQHNKGSAACTVPAIVRICSYARNRKSAATSRGGSF